MRYTRIILTKLRRTYGSFNRHLALCAHFSKLHRRRGHYTAASETRNYTAMEI